MNVLINLATLKKGGGQNVVLNFLRALETVNIENLKVYFSVSNNSIIHKYLRNNKKFHIVSMPRNPLLRIIKEMCLGWLIIRKYKIEIIYTYFGIGLYPKSTPQISGSADSNLYFPEIDFWSEYTGVKRLIRKFTDQYRIWGLRRMEAVIFENEIMKRRCNEIYKIPNTIFIKPSINTSYQSVNFNLPRAAKAKKYKGLFFCGWQRNKNFMIIPLLAAELKTLKIDFHFVITAPEDNSEEHLAFLKLIENYVVGDMISMIGSIQKEEIQSLYEQIDIVFLLSKLESFSNNIIEAWSFDKPLLISDELWAHSICNNAAVYVARMDVKNIINEIVSLLKDEKKRNEIILNGRKMVAQYPTIEERTKQELDYIKYIYEKS